MDNTLLLFNEDAFLLKYARLAAPYFADLLNENQFFQKLLASTLHMIRNDGSMTNVEAFTSHFLANLPSLSYEECFERFDQFYQETFPQLQSVVTVVSAGRRVLQSALAAGLQVAVATNPIFPERATKLRLEWANIADLDIDITTNAENMSYCKPRPEYYNAVLDSLRRQPQECLMVGNDTVSDMSASALGIRTFLVENQDERARLGMLSKQVGQQAREVVVDTQIQIDWRGTLQDVEQILLG